MVSAHFLKWAVINWESASKFHAMKNRNDLKCWCLLCHINSLRPRQNGYHFADDIFKCILLNENVWFMNKISLKCVPKGLINNIPTLVQIMAWRRLATSHYLNQWCLVYRRIYASLGLNELTEQLSIFYLYIYTYIHRLFQRISTTSNITVRHLWRLSFISNVTGVHNTTKHLHGNNSVEARNCLAI